MRIHRSLAVIATVLASFLPAVIVACSSDDPAAPAAPTPSGTYRGLLTGPKESGVLDIVIGPATTTPTSLRPLAEGNGTTVSGTITWIVDGKKVSLSGSYDPATGTLSLSGTSASGGTYSLTGTSSDSGFDGSYSGPNGSGQFSLTEASVAGEASLYCGTAFDSAAKPVAVWNFVLDANGRATGAQCSDERCGVLVGKLEGTKLTLSAPNDKVGKIEGTVENGKASGTWTSSSETGTWSGSTEACRPAESIDPSDAGSDAGDEDTGTDAGDDASSEDAGPKTADTLLTSVNEPVSLALDGNHLYWLAGADATIERCALPDCSSSSPLVTSISVSSGVAAAKGKVYWTHDFRYVASCADPGSGTCTGTTFADLGESGDVKYPAHLIVANDRLYWIAESGSARLVQTCPLAGCSDGYPKTIFKSESGSPLYSLPVAGLAVSASDVYVSVFTGGIFRIALTGPEAADAASITQLQPSAYGTSELDLDGTTLRWGLSGDGKIQQCTAPACTNVTDFVVGHDGPVGTRSTSADVYGIDRGTAKQGGGTNPKTGKIWHVHK